MRTKSVGAGRGRRSPKSGQSNYFVGYKKHTINLLAKVDHHWRAIPVHSITGAANRSDIMFLKPLLNHVHRRLEDLWPLHFIIGDKGYISIERAR